MFRAAFVIIVVLLCSQHCRSWGKFWATELAYPQNPLLVTQSVAMASVTPLLPGSPNSCTATPALPDGLSLANDCTISGTPTRGQGATSYRITVDIGSGTLSTDLRIRVLFQPRFAYVANVADSNVTAFTVNQTTGALSLLATYGSGTGARFVLRDPSGKYIYIANRTAPSIAAYKIDQSTGALSIVSGSPFSVNNFPYSFATDPEGRFLFVGHEDTVGAAVSAFTINASTGAITPVAGSPFASATGASPASVSVSPDGKYLYAGSTQNSSNPNSFGYEINQQTGALTQLTGSPFGPLQNGISIFVHPSGNFVYYAQYSGDNAVGYSRNTTSGALTLMLNSPFAAGSAPGFISGDVNGRFVYVANSGDPIGSSGAHGYTVGANGALTVISGSPFTTGKNPIGVTFDETSRFVYIIGSGETNPTPDPVYAYQLNQQTGAISLIGTYTAGTDATCIAIAGSNP